jgi:hypothetical protein
MISYKDMTFCSAQCRNLDCPRNYTDDIHLAARQCGGARARLLRSRISARIARSISRYD